MERTERVVSVAWKYIQREGLIEFLRRVFVEARKFFYQNKIYYLICLKLEGQLTALRASIPVEVGVLSSSEAQALASASYCSEEEIDRRLCDGQVCVVARHKEKIVHYSWLTQKQQYAREIQSTLVFSSDESYLYNCRTIRSFRGLGIFPQVIQFAARISKTHGKKCLVALVDKANKRSLRSFEKLGFSIKEEVMIRRFLWRQECHRRRCENG